MKAYLSIVRYVPHIARVESVNVGAILACPDVGYFRFDVTLRGQKQRLKCFDPAFNESAFESHVSWIEAYRAVFSMALRADGNQESALSVLTELQRVTRSNGLQVGSFSPVDIEGDVGPIGLDEILEDTLESEVRWYKHIDATDGSRRPFKERMADLFRTAHLYVPRSPASPVKKDYSIAQLGLTFDYGYINGSPNVIETADITDVVTENAMIDKAAGTIVKFHRVRDAAKRGELNVNPIALLSGARPAGKRVSPTIRELGTLADVYFMGEDQDRRRLIEKIRSDIEEHHRVAS